MSDSSSSSIGEEHPPLPHHCGNVHVLAALEGGENEVLEEEGEKAR